MSDLVCLPDLIPSAYFQEYDMRILLGLPKRVPHPGSRPEDTVQVSFSKVSVIAEAVAPVTYEVCGLAYTSSAIMRSMSTLQKC